MINQVVLVGRFKGLSPNDSLKLMIYSEKNVKPFMVDIIVSSTIYKNVQDMVRESDLIGVKGKITEKGIFAERVTFLSAKNSNAD